jgi:alpha-glucosidase
MYYSLAYEAHETSAPLMRPLVMEFPSDAKAADLGDQWLIGKGLMAAPVLQEGAKSRSVYFPNETWYVFESGKTMSGNGSAEVNASLDEIPTFVRAGTILPLAPIIQHTADLPGGPLDLQIYPGKNASFTLVEDDGGSTAYLRGELRRTTFTWNNASRELSWKVQGPYNGKTVFKEMQVTVFDAQPKKIAARTIDAAGGTLRVAQ